MTTTTTTKTTITTNSNSNNNHTMTLGCAIQTASPLEMVRLLHARDVDNSHTK